MDGCDESVRLVINFFHVSVMSFFNYLLIDIGSKKHLHIMLYPPLISFGLVEREEDTRRGNQM